MNVDIINNSWMSGHVCNAEALSALEEALENAQNDGGLNVSCARNESGPTNSTCRVRSPGDTIKTLTVLGFNSKLGNCASNMADWCLVDGSPISNAPGDWCTATSHPSRRLARHARRGSYWTGLLWTGLLWTSLLWTGLLATGLLATGLLARNRTFRALISFGTETAGRGTTTGATPFGTTLPELCDLADLRQSSGLAR